MIYKFKNHKKADFFKNHLRLGGKSPDGRSIEIANRYIEHNGKPWIGVMGEYHFVRSSRNDWYTELCKIRAGGVTVVATYIFWIYHEEIEGEFDFSGDRDVRKFILDAQRAGLDVVIRIGPWAHGECRNGGFPDWLLKKPYTLRENNPEYLEKVREWYEKIYEQVKGLFFKDGGNIVGIQLENELTDGAEHLLELKKIAKEIGLDAPIYTVTGWNSKFGARIPVEEVMPVFGAYPEAPWTAHTSPLPLSPHYVFSGIRNDSAIGDDLIFNETDDGWRLPYDLYPFATCELGGGMQVTHHRRPLIKPMDIYALSLVKLGSGNNLIGYYMYHGGVNKIGRLSALNESKATGYPNDYTVLSYDFQAPISEYGEIRGQYRLINMLHMFVNDFGDILAPMEKVSSVFKPAPDDLKSLRYALRTDGKSGFVFINHYQRLAKLEDVENAVIDTGSVVFPEISVRGDISFIMPFNMETSGGVLEYATVQPLCKTDNAYFFAAIADITPRYKFADGAEFTPEAGFDSAFEHNGVNFVTFTPCQAEYVRKLSGDVYIGDRCDLYECGGEIMSARDGGFAYMKWNGGGFDAKCEKRGFTQANAIFKNVDEPFAPPYADELNIGGKRRLTWKKISVDGDGGFIEINDQYDAAQIYADGILTADSFYYGVPWRIPAKLLYGKECYLVMSEIKNDFYKEF